METESLYDRRYLTCAEAAAEIGDYARYLLQLPAPASAAGLLVEGSVRATVHVAATRRLNSIHGGVHY